MKKTISVIAASLLTATVVFTGCGGGGSSSVTGSTSSSSSSTAQITPKTVTVADGYVLGATVKSGSETAVATTIGHYQFADESKVTETIVSTGGTNDLNENGQADANEPIAPTLKAPASYANVTPMTTLMIEGGLTEEEIINYYNTVYGLNLTTLDFDPVQADAKTKAEVVVLGYLLSTMNIGETRGAFDGIGDSGTSEESSTSSESTSTSSSSTSTQSDSSTTESSQSSDQTCVDIPGYVCSSSSSTSTNTSASSSETTAFGITTLVNAIKNGIKIEDVLPENTKNVVEAIRTNTENNNMEEVICNFTTHKAQCQLSNEEDNNSTNNTSSSSSSNNSSVSSSSSSEEGAFTGIGEDTANSSVSSSSSEESSSESSESSATSTGGAFDGISR